MARSLPSRVSRTIPLRREGGRLHGLTQINGRGSAARKSRRKQNPAYTSLGVFLRDSLVVVVNGLLLIHGVANLAGGAIAAAGGAVLAAVKDDAEVELIPFLFWEELFEVGFGLGNAFAAA